MTQPLTKIILFNQAQTNVDYSSSFRFRVISDGRCNKIAERINEALVDETATRQVAS